MAFSLRLPDELDQRARDRAQAVGISLNSLVCVALDAFLRGGVSTQPSGTIHTPAPAACGETVKKIAQLKQAAEQRATVSDDPKPVLSAKPTKAERRKLAEWYRRNPSYK